MIPSSSTPIGSRVLIACATLLIVAPRAPALTARTRAEVSREVRAGDSDAEQIVARWDAGERTSPVELLLELSKLEQRTPAELAEILDTTDSSGIQGRIGAEDARAALRERLRVAPSAASGALPRDVVLSEALLLTAAELLRFFGRSAEIQVAIEISETALREERVTRGYSRSVVQAFSGILARDNNAYRELRSRFESAPLAVQAWMVSAVGSRATPDSMSVLPRFLGTASELDPSILSQICRLAGAGISRPDDAALLRIQASASSPDESTRGQAALALGWLNCDDVVRELIGMLSDPSTTVQRNAYWSLKRITGVRYRQDPSRWLTWYEGEQEWWAREAPDLFRTLDGGNEAEIVDAIQRISRRRLFRRDLARELERMLDHRDRTIVRLTCTALGTFGSRSSTPGLVALLEHDDEEVRQAAWRALQSITGESFPPEPHYWAEFASR